MSDICHGGHWLSADNAPLLIDFQDVAQINLDLMHVLFEIGATQRHRFSRLARSTHALSAAVARPDLRLDCLDGIVMPGASIPEGAVDPVAEVFNRLVSKASWNRECCDDELAIIGQKSLKKCLGWHVSSFASGRAAR
ncbi:MAG: hypothetical protein OXD30_11205 [Bryobacterales bacterium]|nr:hypothetical protein [Bryobacterales bacterium]